MKNGKLPKDFAIYRTEIDKAFLDAKTTIMQNFLDENGVVDSKKLEKTFQTAQDLEKFNQSIEPSLKIAQTIAKFAISKSDKPLEKAPDFEKPSTSVSKSYVEKMIGKNRAGANEI